MLVSLGAWLQVFFSMEEGPRATQMAQRVTTAVSITRSALVYAPTSVRPALLLDLATKESLRVQPREAPDVLEPLPNSNYWNHVAAEIKNRLGPEDRKSVVEGQRVSVRVDLGGLCISKKKKYTKEDKMS